MQAQFEYRPDLKGIKTSNVEQDSIGQTAFEYRPDLKGIKTEFQV